MQRWIDQTCDDGFGSIGVEKSLLAEERDDFIQLVNIFIGFTDLL